MILKSVLMMLAVAKVIAITTIAEEARVHRDERAYALASRFFTIGEAAQRYATETRLLRPGVAVADITVQELIAQNYLPEGTSSVGPYGGEMVMVARTGAYGHVVIDMSVEAPPDLTGDLRSTISVIDMGGGMVSLQSQNGSARFRMAAASAGSAADSLRFSGAMRAGHALGNDAAR